MEMRVGEIVIPERIDFNFEELKKELTEKADLYASVVYDEEQIKQAKADRAALNKLRSAINAERIRREHEYMKPFIEFKARVEEIIGIIDKPIGIIDKQIKEFEKREQDEKRAKIQELFDALDGKPEWLRLEQLWDDRWLNKGTTFRMIEENLRGWINRISAEIHTIEQINKGAFEAAAEYRRTLDLGKAITEGKRLAAIQREKEAAEAGAPVAADPVEPVSVAQDRNPVSDPADTVRSWIAFEAYLCYGEALKLKRFLDANGIKCRPVVEKKV